MITLEILVDHVTSDIDVASLTMGCVIDFTMKSDRLPSLWQEEIINTHKNPVLIHVIDRYFAGSDGMRWLWDDIEEENWRRFRFIKELEGDFENLVIQSIAASATGRIWVMTDAQFGPDKKVLRPRREAAYLSYYRKFGLRLNSAIQLVKDNHTARRSSS